MDKVKEINKVSRSVNKVLGGLWVICIILFLSIGFYVFFKVDPSFGDNYSRLFGFAALITGALLVVYTGMFLSCKDLVYEYKRKVDDQKSNRDFYKKRLVEVEILLSCPNNQLMRDLILTLPDVVEKIKAKDVFARGSEIIISVTVIRKILDEEKSKLEKDMQKNSQEIKEPRFIAFWRKHILSLRIPRLNIASI